MNKYILVQWPESQQLMGHPRFNECLLVQDIENHIEVGSSVFMCPEDLYEKVFNTNNIKPLRIGNLQFRKSSYLGELPKFPNWTIDYYVPNDMYNREDECTKIDDDFYIYNGIRFHKSIFKNKEYSYSIVHFKRDNEGSYELCCIGDRVLNLKTSELKTLCKLVNYGYRNLNKLNNEEGIEIC